MAEEGNNGAYAFVCSNVVVWAMGINYLNTMFAPLSEHSLLAAFAGYSNFG